MDDHAQDAAPARWSEVTEVSEVWTNTFDPSAEQSRPALTAYRVRPADGRTSLPTIDEIIAGYAGRPG